MNVIDTRLPELLRGSQPLLGMFVGMPVPGLVEMCGHAGFDFVIGQMQHPEVVAAIEHGVVRTLAAGVAPGVLAPTVAEFHRLRKLGVRYIPMVISGLIGNALRSAVAGARESA